MTRKKRTLIVVLFALLSVGTAVYLSLIVQAPRFTILDHAFRIHPLSFALLWSAAFFLSVILWTVIGRLEARMTGLEAGRLLAKGFPAFLPFLAFFLSPLLLSHYLTREDLQMRLALLGAFVAASILALTFLRLRREPGEKKKPAGRFMTRFERLSPRKKAAALFLAAFVVYNLAALGLVLQGVTFSGDEPNYLITADSLFYDGDINLADNYADKDYFHFYSREDHPRLKLGIYGRYGKQGTDHIYPINLPGLSFLLLPFYGLSRLFSGTLLTFILKGSLSVWAALLGVEIYLFAAERWRKERLALSLWAVFSLTAPVFFYAVHLYPEIPVAFMSLLIYRKMSSDKPLKLLPIVGLGLLLATFLWFGVKYSLIFWPLILISVYHLWKTHRAGARILAFLTFPLLSAGLFELYIHTLYGTFSPFSIYEGVMTAEQLRAWKQMVLAIPFQRRLDTLFDYFLDQRDGLLLYAPFYLFAFPGLVEMFRKAKREFFFLAAAALPFILNYAFFTHRQGYSPQGRVLAPLSWIAAVAVGYFLASRPKRFFAGTFLFFAAISMAATALLLSHPPFLYQPTTHDFTERAGDFFVFLSNMPLFLPPYLPSFIKIDNSRYLPNYVWIAAVLVFVLAYVLRKKETRPRPAVSYLLVFALLGAGFFLWALYPRDSLYPVRTIPYSETRSFGLHTFPMGKGVVIKPSGDLYLHIEKKYRIIFSSPRPFQKLQVSYGSEKGEYGVRARFFDLPLFEDRTGFEKKTFVFSPPAFYPVRGLCLYVIELEIEKFSPENMLVDPYYLSITPID